MKRTLSFIRHYKTCTHFGDLKKGFTRKCAHLLCYDHILSELRQLHFPNQSLSFKMLPCFCVLCVQVQTVGKHLQQHLQLLLPVCTEIIKLATSIINSQAGSPDFHSQLEGKRVKCALYKSLLVFFFQHRVWLIFWYVTSAWGLRWQFTV